MAVKKKHFQKIRKAVQTAGERKARIQKTYRKYFRRVRTTRKIVKAIGKLL